MNFPILLIIFLLKSLFSFSDLRIFVLTSAISVLAYPAIFIRLALYILDLILVAIFALSSQ